MVRRRPDRGGADLAIHQAGHRSEVPYNHYSLLKSVEDIFGLDHLGYARPRSVTSFGDDVFGSGSAPASPKSPAPR